MLKPAGRAVGGMAAMAGASGSGVRRVLGGVAMLEREERSFHLKVYISPYIYRNDSTRLDS